MTEGYLFNVLKNVEVTKAAGLDQGKFFERWSANFGISELCNLSMALEVSPMLAKSQK